MKLIYMLLTDPFDWEDIVVVFTQEEAIELSKKNPNARVEILSKKTTIDMKTLGYTPTYSYYKNGVFVHNV